MIELVKNMEDHYIHEKGLSVVSCFKSYLGSCEALAIKCRELHAVIYVVYRPPEPSLEFFQPLVTSSSEYIVPQPPHIKFPNLIGFVGFSFPNVRLEIGVLPPPQNDQSKDRSQANMLLSLIRKQLGYKIFIEPTRKYNMLDLILVNDDKLAKSYYQENMCYCQIIIQYL